MTKRVLIHPVHIHDNHSLAPVNLLGYPKRISLLLSFNYDSSINAHHRYNFISDSDLATKSTTTEPISLPICSPNDFLALATNCKFTWWNGYKYSVHVHNIHSFVLAHLLSSPNRNSFGPHSQLFASLYWILFHFFERLKTQSSRLINIHLMNPDPEPFLQLPPRYKWVSVFWFLAKYASLSIPNRFLYQKPSKFLNYWLFENSKAQNTNSSL